MLVIVFQVVSLPFTVSVCACVTLYVVSSSILMCAISTLPLCASLDVTPSFVPYLQASTSCAFHFASFPQDGWTAVLLAARCGHKEVVQELSENFEANFLHKKKVKAMQTISGSEWLSELCIDRTHAITLTG